MVAREEQPTPDEPSPDEPAVPAAMIEADPEPALAAAPNGADHVLDAPVDAGDQEAAADAVENDPDQPQRQGWWSRWVR